VTSSALPTHGRLARAYSAEVAELLVNPTAAVQLLLDERFSPGGQAWTGGHAREDGSGASGYRLTVERSRELLTVCPPIGTLRRDVVVSAAFRKLDGPPGGTYGLIVRDPGAAVGGGGTASNRFYAARVSDRGEIGVWRRESDHWVDLVPWMTSTAVHQGPDTNVLTLEVVGARLTFVVNGVVVATARDAALDSGGVGVCVGGPGNDVLLRHFTVHSVGQA